MPRRHQTASLVAAAIAFCALGGCASERLAGNTPEAPPPAPAAPPRPAPSPVDMAGRWIFTGGGGTACAMTFGGSAGAAEGSIAPAGGCPGNFFTSRKWSYEQDSLVIRDHKGQPLARLKLSVAGHFEGQSVNGTGVSLAR